MVTIVQVVEAERLAARSATIPAISCGVQMNGYLVTAWISVVGLDV